MDVVAGLPANPQAAKPVHVGACTLHGPMLGTQSRAVPGAASNNHRFHTEGADEAAVLAVVVTTITEHEARATPGPAAPPPHWWNGSQQRNELHDVAAIAAGQADGERDAAGVSDQVVLAARPVPVIRGIVRS